MHEIRELLFVFKLRFHKHMLNHFIKLQIFFLDQGGHHLPSERQKSTWKQELLHSQWPTRVVTGSRCRSVADLDPNKQRREYEVRQKGEKKSQIIECSSLILTTLILICFLQAVVMMDTQHLLTLQLPCFFSQVLNPVGSYLSIYSISYLASRQRDCQTGDIWGIY